MGPYHEPPLQPRGDLGAMAMNRYSAFTKAPALLEPHYQIVQAHIQDTRWGESYPSAEMQLVCSTAPADRASMCVCVCVPKNKLYVDETYLVHPWLKWEHWNFELNCIMTRWFLLINIYLNKSVYFESQTTEGECVWVK